MGVGNDGSSSSLSDNLSSVAFSTFTAFCKLVIKTKILIKKKTQTNFKVEDLTSSYSLNVLLLTFGRALYVHFLSISGLKERKICKL